MGGGGNFLKKAASAVVNPAGYASRQLLGNNNTITKLTNSPLSPVGAASNFIRSGSITGKLPPTGNPMDNSMVNAQPFEGSGQQYDSQGRPILQDFESNLGPNGLLKDVYNVKDTQDMRGINAARTEASRDPGTQSRWAQMAQANARDTSARDLAGQNAQARSQLAMQGGLRSGARERLASQSQYQGLTGMQNANNQIAMQDENNRQKWLQMMPQTELQQAQYAGNLQDKNIGRALTEVGQGRDYNMTRYSEAMKAWGADKSSQEAQAQARAAKETSGLFGGGGFLGLGI